jgi:formate hydrogenlyase transcriptional activator
LDEIGDLPLELQPKLLRVMQEREFERLGSAATIHTDVRVICATHQNLVDMINERQFRADLFYRLGVFPIALPPLRDRPEDIRLLVHHFAIAYAARMNKQLTAISEEFMAALVRHSWPGNVRELQNLIERSMILSNGTVLSGSLPEVPHTIEDGTRWSTTSTPVTLLEGQISHIRQTLQETKGIIGGPNGAAARLGLPRTTLIHRMKRLGITVASVPTSESIPRIPPLSGISHEAARSGNATAHSDVGRECTLAEAEREHILEAVEMADGLIDGQGGAAEALGVPPSTLRSRMKKLGIKTQTSISNLDGRYSMTFQQKLDH